MAAKSQCRMDRGGEEEPRAGEEPAGENPYVNAVVQLCGVYKCLAQTVHHFLLYKSGSAVATLGTMVSEVIPKERASWSQVAWLLGAESSVGTE